MAGGRSAIVPTIAGQARITVTLTPIPGWPAWSAASYRTISLLP